MDEDLPGDEIRRLYQSGQSITKISDALGLNRKHVARYIIANSIHGPTRITKKKLGPPTEEEANHARDLHRRGLTYAQIAHRLEITDHRVHKLMEFDPEVDAPPKPRNSKPEPNVYRGMFWTPPLARLMGGR